VRRATARIEGDLQEIAPEVFEIVPGAAAFAALVAALPGPPAEIVHLWGLDGEDTPETTARELAAILALAAALASGASAGAPRSFRLLTRQAQAIESGEMARPAAAALAGAGSLVTGRLPGCTWRVVDVAASPAGSAGTAAERRLITQLAAELTSGAAEPLVAYRGTHRWVPGVEPLALPAAASVPPRAAAGPCLLSGGLGAEGFPIAAWLARQKGSRLVLLAPAGLPPREEWRQWLEGVGTDEGIAARIRRALRLEELGAELLVVSAEPADAAATSALVRWGALTGIVHVAERQSETTLGLAAGMQTLLDLDAVRRRSAARLAWLVMPPAAGVSLRLFADALAETSAAAEQDGGSGACPWTSLTWGLDTSGEPDSHLELAASVLDRLLATAETGPVVLVSPLPLPHGWNRLGELPVAVPTAEPAVASLPRASGVGFYPRPGLRVAYAPPRDEMERIIAGFWEELLGVAQVGIHDNFLDLGGDSLLATRLVARLRDALEVELPVRLLFERSTVAELAAAVAERRGEQASAETSELVASIRGLSESEIEAEIVRLESIMANEEMLNE
jgi:acyl carrier protein